MKSGNSGAYSNTAQGQYVGLGVSGAGGVHSSGVSAAPDLYKNGSLAVSGAGSRGDVYSAFFNDELLIFRAEGVNYDANSNWESYRTTFDNSVHDGPEYHSETIILHNPSAGDIAAVEADQASRYGITLS